MSPSWVSQLIGWFAIRERPTATGQASEFVDVTSLCPVRTDVERGPVTDLLIETIPASPDDGFKLVLANGQCLRYDPALGWQVN